MKKIKVSYEQFREFENEQMIRDLSFEISSDLAFLASMCSQKDRKEIFGYIRYLNNLRNNAIRKIEDMIDLEELTDER